MYLKYRYQYWLTFLKVSNYKRSDDDVSLQFEMFIQYVAYQSYSFMSMTSHINDYGSCISPTEFISRFMSTKLAFLYPMEFFVVFTSVKFDSYDFDKIGTDKFIF